MLTIPSDLVDAVVMQARNDHPIETCGVIAGTVGSDRPIRLIPMHNIAQSTTFFQFDPQQQLRVWNEMEANNEEPKAYPSREDVMYASEPQAHYLIISTDARYGGELRSFRIVDGKVTEETIEMAQHDGQDGK